MTISNKRHIMLYPMKFKPLLKERIWGGRKLESVFGKKLPKDKLIGESWELSAVDGDVSVISNGRLSGNNLQEMVEVYMGDIVGDKVYAKYGEEFPLLIKLIDAADVLSIQVHPDDELAAIRHNAYGKTEMWYVVDCDDDAELYVGFNKNVSEEEYVNHLQKGTLADILNKVNVKPGDAFFIPAGAIHAIGRGILIAEIQQTSDITYRVFDWNRVDADGNARELHTELALDAIDFLSHPKYNVTVEAKVNDIVEIVSCDYFTTNIVSVSGSMERNYIDIDSCVIYICLEGSLDIECNDLPAEKMKKGDTVLMPAIVEVVNLKGECKFLEVYL